VIILEGKAGEKIWIALIPRRRNFPAFLRFDTEGLERLL